MFTTIVVILLVLILVQVDILLLLSSLHYNNTSCCCIFVYLCSSCISSAAFIRIVVLAFCLYHSYSFLYSIYCVCRSGIFFFQCHHNRHSLYCMYFPQWYLLSPMNRVHFLTSCRRYWNSRCLYCCCCCWWWWSHCCRWWWWLYRWIWSCTHYSAFFTFGVSFLLLLILFPPFLFHPPLIFRVNWYVGRGFVYFLYFMFAKSNIKQR